MNLMHIRDILHIVVKTTYQQAASPSLHLFVIQFV